MMKHNLNLTGFDSLLGFVVLLILFFPPALKAGQLSERARITILTCGPAAPMYATFGHTALWVSDPENHIDEVYNFGTFDSGTSNFYLKFLGGRLQYALSVANFNSFLREYKNENRWVKAQDLQLANEKLNDLYNALKQADRPENRFYRYDFFRDNCSTKIMNLILAASGNAKAIDTLNTPANLTYRKALKHYLKYRPWLQFGINLLLGPFADQQISRKQSCFMPDFLMQEAGSAGLASAPETILDGISISKGPSELSSPMVIFWMMLFFMVALTFWLKISKKISDRTDLFLFTFVALPGLLFMFLWSWSDHVSLHVNLNILWANPLLLVLLWSIPAEKTKFNRAFLLLYSLLLFFFIISFSRLPQKIPLEAMPILSILALRSVNRVFRFKKLEAKIEDDAASSA
jgi:hypothetical protein